MLSTVYSGRTPNGSEKLLWGTCLFSLNPELDALLLARVLHVSW